MGLMEADGSPVFDPTFGRDRLERHFEIDQTMAGRFIGRVFDQLSGADKTIVSSLQSKGLLSVVDGHVSKPWR